MSTSTWVDTPMEETAKEFLVSVELYVSPLAAHNLRKPPPSARKNKRDSGKPTLDDGRKIKEKPSWMSLTRTTVNASTGHWRSATCKLSDEGDGRIYLKIYVDETILFQTVHIHTLSHTDIRQADPSLLLREQCLGIHPTHSAQRYGSLPSIEPVYIQFSTAGICKAWLALLRSFALPEIYEGGYRIHRQVDLTIIQGRNMGNSKANADAPLGNPPPDDEEAADLDVSCEIHINDTLCGRTTVKKGLPPVWQENYTFTDLSELVLLEVTAWKEKKQFKPVPIGAVRITLPNFPRGEAIEGRYPLIHNHVHVGDLVLRIKITEVIILPQSAYASLIRTFDSRNFLDWVRDIESIMRIKTLSRPFIAMAVARNTLIDQICECADAEVDGTSSHNTLFRGNTVLTKVMEHTMAWYGKVWLERSIGAPLRQLCHDNVCIEVDPLKEQPKNVKDTEKGVELLMLWVRRFWDQIWAVRQECPPEMRRLFQHLRRLVETRYTSGEGHQELPWQAISSFVFLRFIVPGLLNPHLFGLLPGSPRVGTQRSLTLIAKAIQNLANLNPNARKEDYMLGFRDFTKQRIPTMIEYLGIVSTPSERDEPQPAMSTSERRDRKDIIQSIHQRTCNLPDLDKEAVPSLPDLIDIPRQLAIVTATLAQTSSRNLSFTGDTKLDEFCAKCLAVEERALQCVSTRTAGRRPSPEIRRASITAISSPPTSPTSPRRRNLSTASPIAIPLSASPVSPRQRKHSRPSTAPGAGSNSFMIAKDAPPSPSVSPTNVGGQSMSFPEEAERSSWSKRLLHIRSTSTDSIPLNGSSGSGSGSGSGSRNVEASPLGGGRPSQESTSTVTITTPEPEDKKKRNVFRSILRM